MKQFSQGRRQLLTGIASSAAAALAAPIVLRAPAPASPARQLVDYYSNRQSAVEVGRQYLRDNAAETDSDIFRLLLGTREAPFASRTELDAFIKAKVRADFTAERVVRVQGWLLSCTEARLCALAALI